MAAVTVRMTDEDIELLRQQAAHEERSMNDVAVLAIRERAARHARIESDREAIERLSTRHSETLELLAR